MQAFQLILYLHLFSFLGFIELKITCTLINLHLIDILQKQKVQWEKFNLSFYVLLFPSDFRFLLIELTFFMQLSLVRIAVCLDWKYTYKISQNYEL